MVRVAASWPDGAQLVRVEPPWDSSGLSFVYLWPGQSVEDLCDDLDVPVAEFDQVLNSRVAFWVVDSVSGPIRPFDEHWQASKYLDVLGESTEDGARVALLRFRWFLETQAGPLVDRPVHGTISSELGFPRVLAEGFEDALGPGRLEWADQVGIEPGPPDEWGTPQPRQTLHERLHLQRRWDGMSTPSYRRLPELLEAIKSYFTPDVLARIGATAEPEIARAWVGPGSHGSDTHVLSVPFTASGSPFALVAAPRKTQDITDHRSNFDYSSTVYEWCRNCGNASFSWTLQEGDSGVVIGVGTTPWEAVRMAPYLVTPDQYGARSWVDPGQLADDVEAYLLLGLTGPYLWSGSRFKQWVEEQP